MGRFYKCFPAKAFNCREEGPGEGPAGKTTRCGEISERRDPSAPRPLVQGRHTCMPETSGSDCTERNPSAPHKTPTPNPPSAGCEEGHARSRPVTSCVQRLIQPVSCR